MLNRFKFFIAVFIVLTATESYGNSYFIVAPGVLHLNLKNRRVVESFIVRNTGKQKIRLRLSPVYFPLNSKTMKMGIPLRDDIVDDISKSLIVSPRIVSLKPGQRRTVRVAFRKRGKMEKGDYRAHILIKTVDSVKQAVQANSDSKGVKLSLNIKLQTAIAVYVHSGKSDASLDFKVKKDNKGNLVITSINLSKYKYDGWFQIVRGNTISKVTRFMVFRESKRNFYIDDSLINSLTIKWGVKKDALEYEKSFKLK